MCARVFSAKKSRAPSNQPGVHCITPGFPDLLQMNAVSHMSTCQLQIIIIVLNPNSYFPQIAESYRGSNGVICEIDGWVLRGEQFGVLVLFEVLVTGALGVLFGALLGVGGVL